MISSVTECRIVSDCDGVCDGGNMLGLLELILEGDAELNRSSIEILSESLL